MLRSGAGDLGLLTLPIEASDLVSVPCFRRNCCWYLPESSTGAQKRIVPADLEKQPFVLFETGSITRRIVEDFFASERITPPGDHGDRERGNHQGHGPQRPGYQHHSWQAAAADVSTVSCSAAGSPGSLVRQTGWLYRRWDACHARSPK